MLAAKGGHFKTVEALIQAGAAVNDTREVVGQDLVSSWSPPRLSVPITIAESIELH